MRFFVLVLILSYLIIPSFTNAQEIRIIRVLDINLFQLLNDDIVKIKNLRTPTIDKSIKEPDELSIKIFKWAEAYFEDREFKIVYTGEMDNNVKIVNIFRTYTTGGDKNVIELYLENGYGEYTGENNSDNTLFLEKQKLAREEGYGIWGNVDTPLTDEYNVPVTSNYPRTEYTTPYILMLPISVLCFGIAWDQFEGASDVQGTIDALKKAGLNSQADDLKSSKARKTIVGVAGLLAGITTVIFALKEVEVRADYDNVSLGVHIPLNK